MGQAVTLSADSTITGMGISYVSGSCDVRMALYEDASGSPGALVAETGASALSVGDNELALSGSDVPVAAGTYWLLKVHDVTCVLTEASGPQATSTVYRTLSYTSSFPDPGGSFSSYNDHEMAIWLIGYE